MPDPAPAGPTPSGPAALAPDPGAPPAPQDAARAALATLWTAAGGAPDLLSAVQLGGSGDLPAAFAVSDLAVSAVAAAGLAVAELVQARHGGTSPTVTADRRLAGLWFGSAIRPQGWTISTWDAIAGDYQTADGWIRLHTNAPHHRAAALAALGLPPEPARAPGADTPARALRDDPARALREAVAQAVRLRPAQALEDAVVQAGGCAAAMRDADAWQAHPQGAAVAAEPLLHRAAAAPGPAPLWPPLWQVPPDRPLQGVRVLDLTRVLAGPVATRFLAGFGAEVLRIDPPWWNEPAVVPDVTRGKRCARLDLRRPEDRATWEALLCQADVLVHGYRPGALEGLGLGEARRRALRPGLVEVSLDAYGWTGPWAGRRGFDSLVQMSSGIAAAGMRAFARDRPAPLPVQALDHATGYLLALAVLRGLTERLRTGAGSTARASLARTAALLAGLPHHPAPPPAPETDADLEPVEPTPWGPARRVRPPCTVAAAPMRWDVPAAMLGSSPAAWSG